MSDDPKIKTDKARDEFIKLVEVKEKRKIKARRNLSKNVWSGFAKYGVIGWTIAVPMLLGIAAGLWLDKNYPCPHSWTLSLMALGLFTGCASVWYWMENEDEKMKKEREEEEKDE
ncbi:MAG TPA: AtpZ/AtpI family protein [Candidatus Wallbacteria bacterium]|nr:AtpZ/AtpI family protein [Candidatus Wallbacteria bacterium]